MHYKKVASVINCDYSERVSSEENKLVHISIPDMFTNTHLELNMSFTHMPT